MTDSTSEDDRSVIIRLPKRTIEETRTKIVEEHLGMLSSLVNAYDANEFKGELRYKILPRERENILAAIFLDDDRIAVLSFKKVNILLHIYNSFNGELIRTELVGPLEGEYHRDAEMIITPMRRILIVFNSRNYIYYYDQDINKIWEKHYPGMLNVSPIILNDDTIILRQGTKVILKSIDKEVTWNFYDPKTLPIRFSIKISDENCTILPYGAKGFIAFAKYLAYLYDDNLTERNIIRLDRDKEITAIKIINENSLLYTTRDNTFVVFDLLENKKISSINLSDNLIINKIEILPFNRCLIMSGKIFSKIARIYDLADMNKGYEAKYVDEYIINYRGNFSNGDVVFNGTVNDGILVHNILENKVTIYNSDDMKNNQMVGISSSDLVLYTNKIENVVSVFN